MDRLLPLSLLLQHAFLNTAGSIHAAPAASRRVCPCTMGSSETAPLLRRRETTGENGPLLSTSKSRSIALLKDAAQRSGNAGKAARLSEVIAELDRDQKQNNLWMGFALFTILNHFAGGIVTMHFLEGWSFADCFYFTVVVTTTVGYGDMAPEHPVSKLYMCYFVFAAVSMISTCLAYTVGLLIDKQEELMMHGMIGASDSDDAEAGVRYGGESASSASTPQQAVSAAANVVGVALPNRPLLAPLVEQLRRLPWLSNVTDFAFLEDLTWLGDYQGVMMTALIFLAILTFGVFVFMRFEKLSFVDALYVTCISATTVGFGDIDPKMRATKSIMTVWLLLSTLTLGKLITDQSNAYVRSRQRASTRRLLSAQMDMSTLERMDADGDGKVDKAEFLGMMLVETGKCAQADVDECVDRFQELDKDSSGHIDPADIKSQAR